MRSLKFTATLLIGAIVLSTASLERTAWAESPYDRCEQYRGSDFMLTECQNNVYRAEKARIDKERALDVLKVGLWILGAGAIRYGLPAITSGLSGVIAIPTSVLKEMSGHGNGPEAMNDTDHSAVKDVAASVGVDSENKSEIQLKRAG